MPKALEQIRRMRGGAQSHLMRCNDGYYYVVKFQNNPQHRRILVNEMLGTRLAARLGLPTPAVAIIEVVEELIRLTPDLAIEYPRHRYPCQPGLHFGSRFPGDPRHLTLHDFLPDPLLPLVENLHDFAGMLVFDKWTCNTNGRQTLFMQSSQGLSSASTRQPVATPHPYAGDSEGYRTLMIDQGFCFSAGEWKFPDAPLRGLYNRNRVYEGITGMNSFGPWLDRLERRITERVLDEVSRDIPPEWYDDQLDDLLQLLETLLRRRSRVPELILDAKKSNRQPFPNWA
jgi:HipA-like protein